MISFHNQWILFLNNKTINNNNNNNNNNKNNNNTNNNINNKNNNNNNNNINNNNMFFICTKLRPLLRLFNTQGLNMYRYSNHVPTRVVYLTFKERDIASWYSVWSWCDRLLDISFMVDPLTYLLFWSVLHDWCNKGRGMCYPVCKRSLVANQKE